MQRYSIITDKLEECYVCKTTHNIHKHEIFFGTGKRQLSIKYGLVVPLCGRHHNLSNAGVHFDSMLNEKLHKIGQEKAMKHYEWTTKDFIRIFGRSYL